MQRPGASERFRYWFDGVMSRGLVALMALLGLASFAFIALVSLVVLVFRLYPQADGQTEELSFPEALWDSLMRTLDSGTMGGDQGPGFRAAMLVVTVGGIILVASLISVISSSFDARVEDLRKGRSRVLETDHTLILGWSTKVFPIISELCIANESRRKAAIVLLAERDKVAMEEEIRAKVPDRGRTRVVVRSGNPMDLTDLEVANPHTSRSVIILAPDSADDPDSVVIKTALALTNNPRRRKERYHIVGEIHDPANLEAAKLVGKDEAHWVLASDVISRITVQTSRQSGLSVVFTELLDFDGDEIYFTDQPGLIGRSYAETQRAFANSSVIGIVTPDGVWLNPPADTVYADGARLIVIAEDDSTIELADPSPHDESAISWGTPLKAGPEQALILGYNPRLHTMLHELDQYVAPGSRVTVVADVEEPVFASYKNLSVQFTRGDSASRTALESLRVHEFEHIVVLSYSGLLDPQRADAKTLITLLHLRDMGDLLEVDLNVVSEMIDDRNRELAEVTQADDFIVSEKLISLMLSQISENDRLDEVFDTLFTAAGSEIYLRPAGDYVQPGRTVNFYTVLEAARRRGETAIGYRLAEHTHSKPHAYGVRVNPDKRESRAFAPEDRIIVLAED